MTTDSPFPTAEVRRLARELARVTSRVAELESGQATSGAGRTSLDGASWVVRDLDGTVRQVIGGQGDGTYTTVDVNAPVPPIPADPVVVAVPGGLKVSWSGAFASGEARPADFRWVEVHVDLDAGFEVSDETRDAALVGRGSVTFATDDYVPHTVRLVARNTSNNASPPSGALTVTPAQVGPGDVAPGGIGTVELDDGAVTPPKSGTGVTSNLVPDPGFNDAGYRAKRTAAPWGFVDASSVGFTGADWAAFCSATTTRAALTVTGTAGVPVIPGESYFIAYDAGRSASGQGRFALEVRFWSADGTEVMPTGEELDPVLAEVRDISSLPTGTFETTDGQDIVPAGAATMTVAMARDDEEGTSTGNFYVDRVEVRSVTTRTTGGQRVETSPSAVMVYDESGMPIGSINSDGSLSMLTGQFGDGLTYKGTELATLLDQRARGEVARVDAGTGSSPTTTSEVLWLEFEFNAIRGRAYKLRSGGLIARNTGQRGIQVRYTVDGTRPLITSPILIYNDAALNQTLHLASDIGGLADAGDVTVRLALTVKSWAGASVYFDPADFALGFSAWVEDTGPRQPATGGAVGSSVQRFTTTWVCSWSQSHSVARGYRFNTPLYQGYYDNVEGDQASLIGFNYSSIAAALAGATIKRVEFFLHAEHWYWNHGGEVWLGTCATANPPANYNAAGPFVAHRAHWHLNKPEGRWVDIPVAIGNELRDGTTRSFFVDPRPLPRNLNDYGRFTGVGYSYSPHLRVTYEKPTA